MSNAIGSDGSSLDKTLDQRVFDIVYSCSSRDELADRIVELEDECERLRRKLEILKDHGYEIVDAVAGGYEIYSNDRREIDDLRQRIRLILADYKREVRPYRLDGIEKRYEHHVEKAAELGIEVDE